MKQRSFESEKVKQRRVVCRIIFLKLGDIDTKNERFNTTAYVECCWEDDLLMKDEVSINAETFGYEEKKHWNPEIIIENAIGLNQEVIQYRTEVVERGSTYGIMPNTSEKSMMRKTVRVSRMMKLSGVFYERLELYDFPMDNQELSIKISSKKSIDEVVLVENKKAQSSISSEEFQDQQQFDLFQNVRVTEETIDDPFRNYIRSQFKCSAFVVRKPAYYIYNAYLMIFLITMLSFTPFSFAVNSPHLRCTVTGLLLLTSINFRWAITSRLPSVSYLTFLDKYSIGCIFNLSIISMWHAIVGSTVITTDLNTMKRYDSYLLYGFAAMFAMFNLIFIVWFYKLNRSVKQLEEEIAQEALERARPEEIIINKPTVPTNKVSNQP